MLTAKESSPTGPTRATESTNKIPNENKYRGTGYPVPLVFVRRVEKGKQGKTD